MTEEASKAALSTGQVREAFAAQMASLYVDDWDDQRAAFDRWLAAHDAEMRAAGVAEGIRQAREAVQAVAEFNDISGREHYEGVLAAIDALESEK